MGREIRRVPKDWQHPKKEDGSYHPMFDDNFDESLKTWLQEYELWKSGEHPDQKKWPEEKNKPYHAWAGGPPDPKYYNHNKNEKVWFQMYETVSEGTPVTPPFETKEELVNYLTQNGTFWDSTCWKKENAESFVNSGWAPSGIVTNGRVYTAIDMAEVK
jgi:hypothetical protein